MRPPPETIARRSRSGEARLIVAGAILRETARYDRHIPALWSGPTSRPSSSAWTYSFLQPALAARAEHRLEVVEVAVDVAVAEQAEEVDRAAAGAARDDLVPRLALEDRAALDRAPDEHRALRVDLARAERVVADLAVAHVVVARQADRLAVGAQLGADSRDPQPVHRRGRSDRDRIRLVAGAAPDAVHHDQDDRTFRSHLARVRAQEGRHGGTLRSWPTPGYLAACSGCE